MRSFAPLRMTTATELALNIRAFMVRNPGRLSGWSPANSMASAFLCLFQKVRKELSITIRAEESRRRNQAARRFVSKN